MNKSNNQSQIRIFCQIAYYIFCCSCKQILCDCCQEFRGRFLGIRGLIHKTHLRKFLSFCKISDFKLTYLKCIFNQSFHFMSAIVIEAWQKRVKIEIFCNKIECILFQKISKTYVKCVSELCEWGPCPSEQAELV